MIVDNQPKILEEQSDNNTTQKKLKNDFFPKNIKESSLIVKETPMNSSKINNETSSKFISSPKIYKDIKNDKKSLEDYLKENNPEFLEKFELIDFLKNGSAGSVMKARPKLKGAKTPLNRFVALKFLNNGNTKKNTQNHDEIIIHGSLKHKNIPSIYGYYKIGNNSCIAMEMDIYGDLDSFKKKVIKRNPLSETLICYILGGLVDAVYYIHTHNKIIHMDIKQQNILVDDYINIKLTDYSVSVCYKNLKKIELPMVGTCYYMSPEVLRKQKINVSDASRIDVYSIGVLLYLLAFCDYPYKLKEVNNKDYSQILKNIEKYELEFPQDCENSKIFLNLIKNCLNKDIKNRYSIYQLMKDPFYQGYQVILNEKEKLYNAGKFVVDLMVDNILNFNKYIKEKEKEVK